MTKIKNIILILILFSITLFISCSNSNNWVAKVDGDKITVNDFNVRFDYYLKSKYFQNPELIPQARNNMEERKAALKDMINERLILLEAKKLKIDKSPEVQNLIRLYNQQIILNNYIEKYLASDLNVSDEEMMAFYNQHKADFRNVDPDMAKRKIKYQLMMVKYDKKITEVIDKLKDKYRIEESENGIRPIYNESSVSKNQQEMMQMPMQRSTTPSPQMNQPMPNQTMPAQKPQPKTIPNDNDEK